MEINLNLPTFESPVIATETAMEMDTSEDIPTKTASVKPIKFTPLSAQQLSVS
jgi:hypothetical protein